MSSLLKFNDVRASRCLPHGNTCSDVCSSPDGIWTVEYTGCSCERQFRDVVEADYFYPVDDVILATTATYVVNKELQSWFPQRIDLVELELEEMDDIDIKEYFDDILEEVSSVAEDAVTAAADAAAAATPGSTLHTNAVTIARLNVASASAAAKAVTDAIAAIIARKNSATAAITANIDESETAAAETAAAEVIAAENAAAESKNAMIAAIAATADAAAAIIAADETAATEALAAIVAETVLHTSDIPDECTVCYGENCCDRVSCGHTVCRSCVTAWIVVSILGITIPSCPICREPL